MRRCFHMILYAVFLTQLLYSRIGEDANTSFDEQVRLRFEKNDKICLLLCCVTLNFGFIDLISHFFHFHIF